MAWQKLRPVEEQGNMRHTFPVAVHLLLLRNDERVDFFLATTVWTGELTHCEPNMG